MKTRLATTFGLAMLSVAFSFSTSFACPETSQTTASAVESTVSVSESVMNVTAPAEASAPEGQVGELSAPASVAGNIEAPSTEPSEPSIANAIPVEITATVVVPGQNSKDQEGPAMPAGIAGTEPSVTEAFSQTAAPESGQKATADSSAQEGAAEAQIEVGEPTVAAVEPSSTDVTAPPAIESADAVPVEITVTVTVVVPGQKSEDIDDAKIIGSEPEHPDAVPNLNRDEATTALDNEE